MEEAEVLDEYSEHELRHLIEGDNSNIISSYYEDKNRWEVLIDQGDYMFSGQISKEGIPTDGSIIHKDQAVYLQNNKQLLNNNFKDTIIGLFQQKINERLQHEYEEDEEEEEKPQTKKYQSPLEDIQEEAGESGSENNEENVIHENTINEEPIKPTQQPQNQSNLNLKSSQSQKFGLGKNK